MRHSTCRPRDTLLTRVKRAEDQVLFLPWAAPPALQMAGSIFSPHSSHCPTHCTWAELFILRQGSLLLAKWIMIQLAVMSGNHSSRTDPLKPKPLHKTFKLFAGHRQLARATGSGFCRCLESISWFSPPEKPLLMWATQEVVDQKVWSGDAWLNYSLIHSFLSSFPSLPTSLPVKINSIWYIP